MARFRDTRRDKFDAPLPQPETTFERERREAWQKLAMYTMIQAAARGRRRRREEVKAA